MPDNEKPKHVVNYGGNSHKSKASEPEERRVKAPVTTGKVIEKKKGLGRKIAESFAGDDAQSVGQYILFEVILPNVKDLISDIFKQGIDRALYGSGSGGRNPRSSILGSRGTSYTSYNKVSSGSSRREVTPKARATHEFNEIILESRGEAEAVLDSLTLLVDEYDSASVADLYDLCEITAEHTDNKWGWIDLRDAEVRHTRDGYLLDLPKPVAL